jgi:hypothetical protein
VITLDVRGLPEIQRMLRNLAQEQLPYAISTAINNTAFAVQRNEKSRMKSIFDRPTPLIQGAFRVEKATKQNLTAKVFVDPKREPILRTHETGGKRGDQAMERYLKSKGWLSNGWRAVPTDKMPLTAYGNPKASEVKKIIAGLPVIGGIKADARRYFVIPHGSRSTLSPGIYRTLSKSKGAAIIKLYHFVSNAQYRARLDFETQARAEAERLLPGEMAKAIERAIRTAR